MVRGTATDIEASATLSSDLASVRLARAFVARALEEWRAAVDVTAVELAMSEIVTTRCCTAAARSVSTSAWSTTS